MNPFLLGGGNLWEAAGSCGFIGEQLHVGRSPVLLEASMVRLEEQAGCPGSSESHMFLWTDSTLMAGAAAGGGGGHLALLAAFSPGRSGMGAPPSEVP